MINEEKIRSTIASNLVHYRKLSKLKQTYIAEKIGYSDKAISKWERGEGIPDIIVLHQLAELYGVKVNDLLSEKKLKKLPLANHNKIVITLLSVGLDWLVATIIFVLLLWIGKGQNWLNRWCYMPYIYAIPITFIIFIVFNKIWGIRLYSFFIVSFLIWSCALALDLSFNDFIDNSWLFYIICVPLEILSLFWYLLKRKKESHYNQNGH